MLKLIQKSLFVFLVFFGLSTPVVYAQSATGVIMRVVDGDTVDIWVNNELQRVRIIGLDTPETVNPRKKIQCFGKEAFARAKELMPVGSEVILELDSTQDTFDKYDRLLVHIFVRLDDESDVSFALQMIAEGFAKHYVYKVPSMYAKDYEYAEITAKTNWLGLWSPETCNGETNKELKISPTSTPIVLANLPIPQTPTPFSIPTPIANNSSKYIESFNPNLYIGQGNKFNCKDFSSQAQAQAVLRADSTDPNKLDTDYDGIACESNKNPKDLNPVKR